MMSKRVMIKHENQKSSILSDHSILLVIIVALFLLYVFVMTGCRSATVPNSKESTRELPKLAQISIGIIKLDGTAQEITQEQARDLLFLWKAYQRLSKEETTAAEEINGLEEQIQEQLNEKQHQTIEGMKISFQDVNETLEKEGIITNNKKSNNENRSSSGVGMPPPDVMIMGGPPGGGMGTERGNNTSNSQGVTRNVNNGVDSRLVEAIIQYLERKAGTSNSQ